MNTLLVALCGLTSIFGATPACEPEAQPIEHVIYDGDHIDIDAPDILTIRFPGADPTDEDWYIAQCDDMGGTFEVRRFVEGLEATCYDVDY
jgi:hypothetical protein